MLALSATVVARGRGRVPLSEKTGKALDAEVRKMIVTAHERTTVLLTKHRDSVENVTQLLLDKEVISR